MGPAMEVSVMAWSPALMLRVSAAALALSCPAAAQVTWPMYQANASHDGYIPVSFDPTTFVPLWETRLSIQDLEVNPVAAADGKVFASLRVYFHDGIDQLFALDASDGSVLWSESFGAVFSVNPPAYSEGKVYLQVGNHGSDTHLYEYDATTGNRLNDGPFSAQWERYYAPTLHAGRIYINGGYYGGMYAFDFSEVPAQQWFVQLDQFDQWTPAVDGQYAYAYTGSEMSIVGLDTGIELWTIPDPNFVWGGWSMNLAPVLGGMDDVLATQGGRLISFDLADHTIRYEIPDEFSGQVSVRQGVVYAFNSGNLEAREQLTGSFLWSWEVPVGWELVGSMILTDAHAIVHARQISVPNDEATYAIDLESHQDVWSYPVGGQLAWSQGVLYIARAGGYLTALSLWLPFADGFESGDASAWSLIVP
jgi:outer membrane protein assembly factor BamB